MAVAGFAGDEIKIDAEQSTLTVRGEKKTDPAERQVLHRGIASRSFEHRFELADYVEVKGAGLEDGLLHVELVRTLPERMKPRTIAIGGDDSAKQIAA